MQSATISFRKYFNKQTITGISSHIAAKKLIFRHHKLRLNISIKRMFEFLAYIPLPTSSINAISDNGFLTLGVNAFSFIL
jgi:hypothetical protein